MFWLEGRYEYGTPGYDRCASITNAGNGAVLLRRRGHRWAKKAFVGSDPDALCLAQREAGAPRAVVEALAGSKGGCR